MIGKRIDSKKKAGVPTMKNRNQTAKVLYLLLTVLAVLTLFAAACAQEQPETDEEDPIEYPNPESPDENAEFPPETPAETGYFGVSAEDLAALDQIYNQMTEFGRSNSGWFGANPDVCSWMGLGCENGSIVRFSFDNVEFFCEIPSALTALPALREIHLTNTLLRGVVPDNFLQKDTLEQVDLSNNLLTGPIPENIYAPGLQNLTLSGNKLTGEKQQMLNERPNLAQCEANLTIDPYREIDLTPGIDGQIPPSIGGLSVMSRLDLSGNNLSGALPYEMTYLWSLGSLFLNDNNTEQPLMTDHPEVIAKLEMIPDKNIDGVVLASPPTVEIPTEVPTDTPEPTWTEIPTEIPTGGLVKGAEPLDDVRGPRRQDAHQSRVQQVPFLRAALDDPRSLRPVQDALQDAVRRRPRKQVVRDGLRPQVWEAQLPDEAVGGPDGVLRLDQPLQEGEAHQPVQLAVDVHVRCRHG